MRRSILKRCSVWSGMNGHESREPGLDSTSVGHEVDCVDLITDNQNLQSFNRFDRVHERRWRIGWCHYAHGVVIVARGRVRLFFGTFRIGIGTFLRTGT